MQSSLNIAHLNSIHFAVNLVIDPDNNFHLIILSFLITWLLDNVWILSLYREKQQFVNYLVEIMGSTITSSHLSSCITLLKNKGESKLDLR